MTTEHPADDYTRDIPPATLILTARAVHAARPGIETNVAMAAIEALLTLGWRPPPAARPASDLTDNARQEIAHLTQFAADTQHDPDERAAALLTAHQRRDAGSCLCGWAQLGMSHALHQAEVLADAGLLAAASLAPAPKPGDGPCHDCGSTNIVWSTDSALWNLVIGGPAATDDPGGLLCVPCFVGHAEALGIAPAGWYLGPWQPVAAEVGARPSGETEGA